MCVCVGAGGGWYYHPLPQGSGPLTRGAREAGNPQSRDVGMGLSPEGPRSLSSISGGQHGAGGLRVGAALNR